MENNSMTYSYRTLSLLLLAALPALMGLQCGESITRDPEFQLWCGDQLCQWSTDQGAVHKVPTWDRNDNGVELVGDTVAISQTANITNFDATCIDFDLVASVATTATVRLQMDFLADGDGGIDYDQVIPSSDWAPLHYQVKKPTGYWKVRFILRKDGPGRAVLARIRATVGDDCSGPAIARNNRPSGVTCETDGDCHGGHCVDKVCGECNTPTECPSGQVCGLRSDSLSLYASCVAAGAHSLAERCRIDGECATGVCCQGVCSTCCGNTGCTGDAACSLDKGTDWSSAPSVCAPQLARGAKGTPCLYDQDCGSHVCLGSGPLKQCFWDGRTCSVDNDCLRDPSPKSCVTIAGATASGLCQ
jgi:hypothetical protein